MLRAAAVAMVSFALAATAYGQAATGVLHIKIVLLDAAQKPTPVAKHALLISDNPTTAAPRRILTGPDGTVDLTLRPGNYTVESDQPVALEGKAYGWTQLVDIVAGRDTTLELTTRNAEIGPIAAPTGSTAAAPTTDPSFLFNRWQSGVVTIWTPTARGSGFVVDEKGLVATNQRLIGTSTAVEVQLTATTKVAGRVLVADQPRDVAFIRIDPASAASAAAVPLGCEQPGRATLIEGQEIITIGVVPRRGTDVAYARVRRVDPHTIASDLRIESGFAGGPVFSDQGVVVGITSVQGDQDRGRADARVVRIDEACQAVASARQKMTENPPPSGTHLPIEPASSVSMDTLKSAATRRVGSLNPYQASSATFDLAFFTPIITYAAQFPLQPAPARGRAGGKAEPTQVMVRPITDFSNWSEYVAEVPPVLLVRVMPRQVESFWTTVARGAAQTQGVSVPAMKHAKGGFVRMQAYCGDVEVTPIHPFMLQHQVSERDTISEGLYVFDAAAFRPQCGTVKMTLVGDKEPSKPETVTVDPKVVQQIWDDFALYRTPDR
ncbi:MAG TPA: serine protease [Vicinamibacterales bacterium]|jgi:S1-C subfamily serine protease